MKTILAKRNIKIAIFIIMSIFVCILLVSCLPEARVGPYYPDGCEIVGDGKLCRIVDHDAGVVCWVYLQKGVSCMSISETTLRDLP